MLARILDRIEGDDRVESPVRYLLG